jgi:hypothetical protein
MAKVVKVTQEIKEKLPLNYLSVLQGNLKVLPDDRYKKLKASILKHGFVFPFFVWDEKENNKHWIIDGSQRYAALTRMKDEGYKIPQLPVVFIPAESVDDAKSKILAAASQFGQFTDFGVAEFLKDVDFDAAEIKEMVEIPFLIEAMDNPVVLESDDGGTFTDVSAHKREIKDYSNEEVKDETKPDFRDRCPHCGKSL